MPDSTSSPTAPPLKVGALARQTGLTVRALHHYESVGLLTPAGRTASGHRYYGSEEIRRLHQITSLRQLGLSLPEIAGVLDDPNHTLEATLDRHLEGLRARIREEEELCRRLEALRDRIRRDPDSVPLAELAESVHRTVRFESYFSQEQLARLSHRRRAAGAVGMARGEAEWGVLLDDFRAAMDEGLPPEDARVAELARRAAVLVEAFTGGDADLAESLGRMYREEGPERVLEGRGISVAPGLWEYMARAREAHGFGSP
jgi:DNA-binding transcriptional MerR regulator